MKHTKGDFRAVKYTKELNKKLGNINIYSLLSRTDIDVSYKIKYIRHHFAWYEGHYEFFHDERGNPNENKEKLDSLIRDIVLKKANPEELLAFNNLVKTYVKNSRQLTGV